MARPMSRSDFGARVGDGFGDGPVGFGFVERPGHVALDVADLLLLARRQFGPPAGAVGGGRFAALAHHPGEHVEGFGVADPVLDSAVAGGDVAVLEGGEDQPQRGDAARIARLHGGLEVVGKAFAQGGHGPPRCGAPAWPIPGALSNRSPRPPRRAQGLLAEAEIEGDAAVGAAGAVFAQRRREGEAAADAPFARAVAGERETRLGVEAVPNPRRIRARRRVGASQPREAAIGCAPRRSQRQRQAQAVGAGRDAPPPSSRSTAATHRPQAIPYRAGRSPSAPRGGPSRTPRRSYRRSRYRSPTAARV